MNKFMFRFTLLSGLSRGAGLSSGWPLKRGSTVFIKSEGSFKRVSFTEEALFFRNCFENKFSKECYQAILYTSMS